ncbi:MobA/MobL family protein [Devosia sp. BSSL-BM10]|uniref:MobA/MobL family protein n=1 Tax=Devosia litorisediminis TaxID=2829817 RepID=A0A942E5F5_9HYPH|nr:MobA/MobL family protein [Devosia litorisediminis]MBS3848538.1 MobA/MobL family protein [Devosia litorisediminis]
MAIAFARVTQIQRSLGHSTIQRLAYLTRTQLVSQRTGEMFDYSDRQDGFYTSTVLPLGCENLGDDVYRLWELMETASTLPKAVLGFELLLSLPMPAEFELQGSCTLAEQFVRQVIVEKHGLAATLAVHTPHDAAKNLHSEDLLDQDGDTDEFARIMAMASANLHCHVLVSPRQLTPQGAAKKRYTTLDPINRNGIAYGRNWGRLWHLFQNQAFERAGSTLRVTPNPPIALRPVPITAVRRWRRSKRTDDPQIDGRALLVNTTREQENREVVECFDGAVACFKAPFTRVELETFYARYVLPDHAKELVEATIGLGLCVELDIADSDVEWFAGVHLVQSELAALGRALMLSERSSCKLDVSYHVRKEFSSATRTVLEKLFAGSDVVIVEAQSRAELLAQDIAGIANRAGIIPVTIATPAGHPAPRSALVEIKDLSERMISQAIIIIDDPDSMAAAELSLALASALAGNNKVVLLRRGDSDWPSLELLDVLSHHVQVLKWQPMFQASLTNGKSLSTMGNLRTAIVHKPLGHFSALPSQGWPLFCVDAMGEVSTSPSSVAATMQLLATFYMDIHWRYPGYMPDTDAAGLSKRLDAWLQTHANGFAAIDASREVEWDEFVVEDAAFGKVEQGDREEPEEYVEIDGPLLEEEVCDNVTDEPFEHEWDDFEPGAEEND